MNQQEIVNENENIGFYKIICRDGEINIPKSEFENIMFKDWFINKVFEYDKTNVIDVWEDKNIVSIILDSVRYNKLVLDVNDKNINISYLQLLAEKWCIQKNIIEEIEKLNFNKDILEMFIPKINECSNCGMGFKDNENNSDSCIHHEKRNVNNRFACCGIEFSNVDHPKRNGCKKGYHVKKVDSFVLSVLSKLLSKNNY